jgi:glycosyltransferase involved in cell wall biosynthesis
VIRELSGTGGERVDAIFFACMYAWDFEYMRAIQPFLRLPWMGLYIHALPYRIPGQTHSRLGHTVPRPHSMFGGALCRGIAILDEGIVEKVSTSVGRPVAVFPDVPDERPAATEEERKRGDDLKRFAHGRPVIGLFGHLHQSKGVGTFLETIRSLPEDGLCFALAGEVWGGPEGELSRQVQRTLSERANLWTHLERLPDEPHLNHLLAACDVIVAAYWDFPHSSGIQSKAAALKKPVIVSDGHLMAERSRRYHLGEVVPQKDPVALGAAIQKLTGGAKSSATVPRWEEYREAHSFDRLKSGLKELLGQI